MAWSVGSSREQQLSCNNWDTSNKAIVTNDGPSLVSRACGTWGSTDLVLPTPINKRCHASSLTHGPCFPCQKVRGEKTKRKIHLGEWCSGPKHRSRPNLKRGHNPVIDSFTGPSFNPRPPGSPLPPHTKSPGSESGPMVKLLEKAPPPNREVGYAHAS